jgi:hypothetical protein
LTHSRSALFLTWTVGVVACAEPVSVGMRGEDASRPAIGRYDECGNGLDDDGDGAIDEDCPCGTGESQPCWDGARAARGVGACGDGVQQCSAAGSDEFGRWLSCTMSRGPDDSESCEGSTDEDCDGAIDEGCTCTEGASRACTGPSEGTCSAGAQSCRGGTWSACEGAISPSAEVCGNGLDDDCDGVSDDPSFCSCSPVPEICGNGADDDCDGTSDETPCAMPTPDAGMPDAGMPTPDAGMPTPDAGMPIPEDGGTLVLEDAGACTPAPLTPGLVEMPPFPPGLTPVDVVMATDGGSLWVSFEENQVANVDLCGRIMRLYPVSDGPTKLSVGGRGTEVWIATSTGVARLDRVSGDVRRFPSASPVTDVSFGNDARVWFVAPEASEPIGLIGIDDTVTTYLDDLPAGARPLQIATMTDFPNAMLLANGDSWGVFAFDGPGWVHGAVHTPLVEDSFGLSFVRGATSPTGSTGTDETWMWWSFDDWTSSGASGGGPNPPRFLGNYPIYRERGGSRGGCIWSGCRCDASGCGGLTLDPIPLEARPGGLTSVGRRERGVRTGVCISFATLDSLYCERRNTTPRGRIEDESRERDGYWLDIPAGGPSSLTSSPTGDAVWMVLQARRSLARYHESWFR